MSQEGAIRLCGVSKSYGGSSALAPCDLEIAAGERLVLLGPSGSGKSTLLRLIAGLETPDLGEIWISGKNACSLAPHQRGVSYLPQRPVLYPELTVAENLQVAHSATSRGFHFFSGKKATMRSPRETQVTELLNLEHLLGRYPRELSGGEAQRAALAALLLRPASILLLDEPFAPLDPMFRSEFRHNLHLLIGQLSATMIIVTHDPIDASALGRRIGVLESGRLRSIGTAEELRDRASNRFAAFCLGRYVLVEGRAEPLEGSQKERGVHGVHGVHGGWEFVSLRGDLRIPLPDQVVPKFVGQELTLGIRPEDIQDVSGGQTERAGHLLQGWSTSTVEPVGSRFLTTLIGPSGTRLQTERKREEFSTVGEWRMMVERSVWFESATGDRLERR